MRIVQIIDSLEVGGAEKMAISYANSLSDEIEFSGLISTRKEGLLLNHLNKTVPYLFLQKRSSFDLKAIFRLRNYLKINKIQIIHAHSSSFFIAVLVKFTMPRVKIIWHDHFGISQNLKSRKNIVLKLSSLFFSGIISVNSSLRKWAKDYLYCPNTIYLPNFIEKSKISTDLVKLKGKDGKRIICVANLRPQKNHELLIDCAFEIQKKFPDWTFHLIGKDFNDLHSKKIKKKVEDLILTETVFFYGALENTRELLKYCEIGVLTSFSEGLPLALLEYGFAGMAVIATNVGEIPKIILSEKEGLLIESNNLNQFVKSVERLIKEEDVRLSMGKSLKSYVELNFSEKPILEKYSLWLKSLANFAN